MQAEPSQTESWLTGRGTVWILAAIWLEMALVSLVSHWGGLSYLNFNDPDDAMRLVQVRDFLAGQSWFDVTQYRANPPVGGPMHWSRLVDMPIAVLILLLRPVFGAHLAEVLACTAVPLLTLAVLLGALHRFASHLLDRTGALAAAVLLALSPAILIQLTPLRIDHHGWQLALFAIAMAGFFHPDTRRGGWLCGGAVALWLHISSEGLPMAAVIGGVLALRHAGDAREWPRLHGYVWGMAGGSLLLLMLTRGMAGLTQPWCDAISPVYLWPLLLLAAMTSLLARWAGQGSMFARLWPVSVAAGAAAALFLATGRQCLAGPFSAMDPLVYQFWYMGVDEGRPIWAQDGFVRALIVLPVLLGMAGNVLALRNGDSMGARRDWGSLLALLAGAFLIACMVMRAMSVAHLLALPGNAVLILSLHRRIRDFASAGARILATVALMALTPIGAAALAALALAPEQDRKAEQKQGRNLQEQLAALDQLPPAIILAPIDVGPDILLRTRHSVIGTAHHRNLTGLEAVIATFLSSPDKAKTIARRTSARYLLVARGTNEQGRYISRARDGLMARLEKGNDPDWLVPVPLRDAPDLRLYRIVRP